MKKLAVLFLIFSSLLSAQVESSGKGNPFVHGPRFYFEIVNYKGDSPEKSKVEVFVSVPYSNIQFVKYNNEYKSEYNLTATFYKNDDEIVSERMWKEKVVTPNFKITSSKISSNLSYKTFFLEPAEYTVSISLEDLESRKSYQIKTKTKVLDFSDSLDLSDILLISKIIKVGDKEQVIPNIANTVTSRDSSLYFFFEVYSNKPDSLNAVYTIKKTDGEQSSKKSSELTISKGKNVIYQKFENQTFELGKYDLLVQLYDKEGKKLKGIGKRFTSKIYGFPRTITNLDDAVDEMVYIANPSQISDIKDAPTYKEKLKRFLAYWKKKDPSPNTVENEILDEYYRRVSYANRHFRSYYDGWKTDMGMIYITLGPPDQVERRPVAIDSKPYEIWAYYNIGKTFIFVDQTNFGDYRLLNPVFGNWYRYRP